MGYFCVVVVTLLRAAFCIQATGTNTVGLQLLQRSAIMASASGESGNQCEQSTASISSVPTVDCAGVTCSFMTGTQTDILDKIKPCGTYKICCPNWTRDFSIVHAERDYPSHNDGELYMDGRKYIVRFDIGINGDVFGLSRKTLLNPNTMGEQCLEGVMRLDGENNDWYDLGMSNVGSGAYNCMGACGAGCVAAGYAKDCLKHDLCSAYKTAAQGFPASGFCDDPDCGDEGAQTVYGCQLQDDTPNNPHRRRFTRRRAAACDCCEPLTHGGWSSSSLLVVGDCTRFLGCSNNQGLMSDTVTLYDEEDPAISSFIRYCALHSGSHVTGFDLSVVEAQRLASPALNRALLNETLGGSVVDLASSKRTAFWLVKSEPVQMQGIYVKLRHDAEEGAYLETLVVGGPFIQGKTLVIEPKGGRVLWDGEEMDKSPKTHFSNLISQETYVQDHRHALLKLELPMGINITAVRFPRYLAANISLLSPLPGGQDGECGNFDGDEGNDDDDVIPVRMNTRVQNEDLLLPENLWRVVPTA